MNQLLIDTLLPTSQKLKVNKQITSGSHDLNGEVFCTFLVKKKIEIFLKLFQEKNKENTSHFIYGAVCFWRPKSEEKILENLSPEYECKYFKQYSNKSNKGLIHKMTNSSNNSINKKRQKPNKKIGRKPKSAFLKGDM